MAKTKHSKYSGISTTTDGSGAIVWVDSHICEGACAYPITPATGMGNGFQQVVANGQKNIWDHELFFLPAKVLPWPVAGSPTLPPARGWC